MGQRAIKRLRLENGYNVRDLGGYMTSGKTYVGWNRLYRADGLANLTTADWDMLKEAGVCTIVDLRSKAEIEDKPDCAPEGMHWFSCPLQKENLVIRDGEDASLGGFAKSLTDGYITIFEEGPDLVAGAIKRILESLKDGAVLFHCSAGKDRTGVVAAILYRILGIEDEDIIADYQVSFTYNKRGVNKYMSQLAEFEKYKYMLTSEASNMETFLAYLDEHDWRQVLISEGISTEMIKQFGEEVLVQF